MERRKAIFAMLAVASLILMAIAGYAPVWHHLSFSGFNSDANKGTRFDFNYTKVTLDGNIMPTGELIIPSSLQPAGGLVGYWKLDSNAATVAYDYSGTGNNGTFQNGADSTGSFFFDQNCGFFDGITDRVTVGRDSSLDFSQANQMTVSVWIKLSTTYDSHRVVSKWDGDTGASTSAYLGVDNQNTQGFSVRNNIGGSMNTRSVTPSGEDAWRLNTWHHIAYTYDGQQEVLYKDGKSMGRWSNSGAIRYDTDDIGLRIGEGAGTYFNGEISEVKLFNRALNETEIANEYNRNIDGNSLVAYWNFNDTNSTGNGIIDQAGYDSNGHLLNGADINAWGMWDSNAGFFDGVDDYISLGKPTELQFSNEPFSIVAWVKSDGSGTFGRIIGADSGGGTPDGYRLYEDDTQGTWVFKYDDGGAEATAAISKTAPNNTWQHITGTYDGTNIKIYINGEQQDSENIGAITPTWGNVTSIHIGARATPTNFYKGQIDELKVYNHALTPIEIQADYNSWANVHYYSDVKDLNAPATVQGISWDALFGSKQLEELNRDVNLVAWLRFNDNNSTGNLAKNDANRLADGQLINGADLNGTGWDDTNAAFFDGKNDYMRLSQCLTRGDDASNKSFTINSWIKPVDTSGAKAQYFYGEQAYGDGFITLYYMDITTDGKIGFYTYDVADGTECQLKSQTTTFDGKWHNFAVVSAESQAVLYMDGVLEDDGSTNCSSGVTPFLYCDKITYIGSDLWYSNDYGNVELDEFRVYKRPLNSDEVRTLYAAGLNDLNVSVRVCDDPSCVNEDGNWAEFDLGNRFHSFDSNSGLVLDLNFNDVNSAVTFDANSDYVLDASGKENHGFLVGTADINAVGKNNSRALHLNGNSSYLDLGDKSDFDAGTGPYTLSIWVKGGGASESILVKDKWAADNDGFFIFTSYDQKYDYWVGSPALVFGLVNSSWNHLAVVREGTGTNQLKGYMNGVQTFVGTDNRNLANNSPLRIGASTQGPTYNDYFTGQIDNTKIYNRALSPGEVMGLYLQGNPNKYLQYKAEFLHSDANYPIGYAYLNDVEVEYNRVPDANIWKVESNDAAQAFPIFNYGSDGNLTIDFNVFDWDGNDHITAELFYSTTNDYGQSTKIASGLLLDDNICSTLDFNSALNGAKCSYDWNIMNVPDGNYYAGVQAVDSVGNADFNVGLYDFGLDAAGPATNANDFNNSWNNTDQNLQFSCVDAGIGCKNFYYSVDDVNMQASWGHDQNIGVLLSSDGNHKLWFWSDDFFDQNGEAKEMYSAVDKTAPSVSITSPGDGAIQTSSSVTITYSGSDALSGVAKYYVRSDGGNWISAGTSTSHEFSGQGIGNHSYGVKSEDSAGNQSGEASITVTINSDTNDISSPGTGQTTGGGAPVGGYSGSFQQQGDETGEEVPVGTGFSMAVVWVDSQVRAGETVDFVYSLGNNSNVSGEAEASYSLERDGEVLAEKQETVEVQGNEKKEVKGMLELPEEADGTYNLDIEVLWRGHVGRATKQVFVGKDAEFLAEFRVSRLPSVIVEQPVRLEFAVETNKDELVLLQLKEVLVKDNEVVWKQTRDIEVQKSKTVKRTMPELEKGEYLWFVTLTGPGISQSIQRTIRIDEAEQHATGLTGMETGYFGIIEQLGTRAGKALQGIIQWIQWLFGQILLHWL